MSSLSGFTRDVYSMGLGRNVLANRIGQPKREIPFSYQLDIHFVIVSSRAVAVSVIALPLAEAISN